MHWTRCRQEDGLKQGRESEMGGGEVGSGDGSIELGRLGEQHLFISSNS